MFVIKITHPMGTHPIEVFNTPPKKKKNTSLGHPSGTMFELEQIQPSIHPSIDQSIDWAINIECGPPKPSNSHVACKTTILTAKIDKNSRIPVLPTIQPVKKNRKKKKPDISQSVKHRRTAHIPHIPGTHNSRSPPPLPASYATASSPIK